MSDSVAIIALALIAFMVFVMSNRKDNHSHHKDNAYPVLFRWYHNNSNGNCNGDGNDNHFNGHDRCLLKQTHEIVTELLAKAFKTAGNAIAPVAQPVVSNAPVAQQVVSNAPVAQQVVSNAVAPVVSNANNDNASSKSVAQAVVANNGKAAEAASSSSFK
jgi:hypothetical protein